MRYLAVDYGAKRLGLALCDPDEILVSPLATIERTGARGDSARLLELVRAHQVEGIVFGVPRALQEDQVGPSEVAARNFTHSVRQNLSAKVPHLVFEEQDERFSTAQALRQGRESGLSQKKGRSDSGAQSIDARSAAVILQSFLDAKAARRAHQVDGELDFEPYDSTE
jgi:putative Holliday junction resolvase